MLGAGAAGGGGGMRVAPQPAWESGGGALPGYGESPRGSPGSKYKVEGNMEDLDSREIEGWESSSFKFAKIDSRNDQPQLEPLPADDAVESAEGGVGGCCGFGTRHGETGRRTWTHRGSGNSTIVVLNRRPSVDGDATEHKLVRQAQRKKDFVLNPRSKILLRWDIYICALLVFTAVVTPFEVSFLETKYNAMFVLNRLVDLSFTGDMLVQFFLPFQTPENDWIVDRRLIWKRYLKGWFPIDVVSVFPYDLVALVAGHDRTRDMKVLRIVRLLRLIKLLRILRAGRMFQRWESQLPVNYSVIELIKFVSVVMVMSHWLGCGWHMVGDLGKTTDEDMTWVQNYSFVEVDDNPFAVYLAAYYWAVATLTTLGYGDIVPTSDEERVYATICALIGATVYAYIIGAVCAIVAGMSEADTFFYKQMDSLNLFMKEKNLTQDLRIKLRDFFRFLRFNSPALDRNDLLMRMSPKLRGQVSLEINAKWIKKVNVFSACSEDFVVALSMALQPENFARGETVVRIGSFANKMYIVDKGLVGVMGRVVSGGGSFGDDMVYSRTTLTAGSVKRTWSAKTLTNSALHVLRQRELTHILSSFPTERSQVRRAAMKNIFRESFLKYSQVVKKIWQKYPDARLADWRDEIEKCKGDPSALLSYFEGKMEVESKIKAAEERARAHRAAGTIAANYRLLLFRKGVQDRRESKRQFQKGQWQLKAFLSNISMSQYEPLVAKHHLALEMLRDISPEALVMIGVSLGHAITILRLYQKKHGGRKQQKEKAEDDDDDPKSAAPSSKSMGDVGPDDGGGLEDVMENVKMTGSGRALGAGGGGGRRTRGFKGR